MEVCERLNGAFCGAPAKDLKMHRKMKFVPFLKIKISIRNGLIRYGVINLVWSKVT